jgi:hypothetical protein
MTTRQWAGAPSAELTCVGTVHGASGAALYEMAFADIVQATGDAERVLASWGVGRNDHVLLISATSEYLQVYPWQRALARLEATFSCADNAPYDAARVAMFLQDFAIRLVIGLDRRMVEALREIRDDAVVLLGRPDAVLVRSDAIGEDLDGSGWWQPIGPGVIAECSGRDGGHVIPSTLGLAASGSTVTISDATHRWPAPGGVVADGRACSCGCAGPRVTRPETAAGPR